MYQSIFQKSMLSYQSIVKKQEMTERVKRHPPAYRRKLNMAKRKNQKRRSKKYQVNNRQLKAKRMYKDTIFRMLMDYLMLGVTFLAMAIVGYLVWYFIFYRKIGKGTGNMRLGRFILRIVCLGYFGVVLSVTCARLGSARHM